MSSRRCASWASATVRSLSSASPGIVGACTTSASSESAPSSCITGTDVIHCSVSVPALALSEAPSRSPSSAMRAAARLAVPFSEVRVMRLETPSRCGDSYTAPPRTKTPAYAMGARGVRCTSTGTPRAVWKSCTPHASGARRTACTGTRTIPAPGVARLGDNSGSVARSSAARNEAASVLMAAERSGR